MLYVLDTSALLDAWWKWYSPSSHPAFWDKLYDLAMRKEATIPDAVVLEIEEKDANLYKWCKERESVICTPSEQAIQDKVTLISNTYPNLRRAGDPKRNFADPVVIAVAQHLGAAVVAHEIPAGNLNGPKIPDVCKDMKIKVRWIYHIASEQKWVFR